MMPNATSITLDISEKGSSPRVNSSHITLGMREEEEEEDVGQSLLVEAVGNEEGMHVPMPKAYESLFSLYTDLVITSGANHLHFIGVSMLRHGESHDDGGGGGGGT